MPRRTTLILTALVCVVIGSVVAPASARAARPAAPYVVASTPGSMTLTWPSTHADRYRVSYGRSVSSAARSSAPSRTTRNRSTSLEVSGLQAGTTYCFTVRAVRHGRAGAPSRAHCHATPRRTSTALSNPVSTVTFNVCGTASGCGSWSKRQQAVLRQIDRSRADVVALQETGHRRKALLAPMRQRGFEEIVYSRDEVLYFRTSRLDKLATAYKTRACRDQPYEGSADTSLWERPYHGDRATHENYAFVDGGWYEIHSGCPNTSTVLAEEHAYNVVGHGRSFVFAALRDRRTGRSAVFVSTHLSNGRSRRDIDRRRTEVARLISKVSTIARGRPVVLAGDFNSDATRTVDHVGRALAKAGYRDTFQNSSTYRRPQLNSFNGYHRTPRRDDRWGGHIDRIFTSRDVAATRWEVVARLVKGRYAGPWASDHDPVRVSLYLPHD